MDSVKGKRDNEHFVLVRLTLDSLKGTSGIYYLHTVLVITVEGERKTGRKNGTFFFLYTHYQLFRFYILHFVFAGGGGVGP